jgi:hypothetical protein
VLTMAAYSLIRLCILGQIRVYRALFSSDSRHIPWFS